jgi:hypothetical protein
MRLAIGAGILAVSLPSDAHMARAGRKHRLQAFDKANDHGSTGATTTDSFGRRLGTRNRKSKSPRALDGGVVLKNNYIQQRARK